MAEQMDVSVGSRLVIPCQFHLDDPTKGYLVRMEWGFVPRDEGYYRPLINRYSRKKTEHFNSRASMFNKLVDRGNCSLVMDPIQMNDTGMFELSLSIGDMEYSPPPVVDVIVSEGPGYDMEENEERTLKQRKKCRYMSSF
ncbi:unnamed protein product [Staurois parvus]|uniref:Immunoglobulin V-set domain-containing protein n=1 Tax=Staurois parvus TaxID=386267 RepID=A0ABN9DX17_9NEOB|nr:unnamed protein product [Staurois parvus]